MSDLSRILEHVVPALLVVFRITGLMIYGPVFGSTAVPARVRILLSFSLGISVYPILVMKLGVHAPRELALWTVVPLIAMELLLGLIVGYLASLPLLALQTGGLIMGQQMGLGFASLYNPAIDDEADIVGQLLFFMALAAFLVIGGHEWMLLAVLHSFDRIPLGGLSADGSLLNVVSGMLASSLELALRVATPLLALVFLETVAMGFVAKTVPQLNILSLGFPLRILIGIAVTAAGLVVINDVAMDFMIDTLQMLFHMFDNVEQVVMNHG